MEIRIAHPFLIYEVGKRENQEDSCFPLPNQATDHSRLFVICDGMGGLDNGEVASSVVCQAFCLKWEQLHNRDSFSAQTVQKALLAAYQRLNGVDTSHTGTMGTTLVMLSIHQKGATFAHIGDSRGYLISPSRQEIFHSKDHSYVQELCDMGVITAEEMRTHPKRNILMQVIMPHMDEAPQAEITHLPKLLSGDYLMLCSDGIIEKHDDKELLALFSDGSLSDEEKVQKLRQMTQDNSDNHTAYVIPVVEVKNALHCKRWIYVSLMLMCVLVVLFMAYNWISQ